MAAASFSSPPKTTSLLVMAVVKPIWVRSRPGQLVLVARVSQEAPRQVRGPCTRWAASA